MRLMFFFTLIVCFIGGLQAQSPDLFILPKDDGPVPWKGAEKTLKDESFRFAIVADRTGGMQPGIFERAVEKLNLLQPEFVVSVGDLVEGYTTNRQLANEEWNEFDGLVKQLNMPFFYLPGNHDYTNSVMKEIWDQRLGNSYYHFLYKNVLFLCLNTEDDNFNGISEEQVNYFNNVLVQNKNVRWTFVFMHAPLWDYGNPRGYEKIEVRLKDREYTLFSGHHHNYVVKEKNGNKHFVLATTGGGTDLRGPEFGELHHMVWVTMQSEGPLIANLAIEGIHDENLVIEEDYPLVQTLRNGSWFSVNPVVAAQDEVDQLRTKIVINNPSKKPLKVSGSLDHPQDLLFEPAWIESEIPAESEQTLEIKLRQENKTIKISSIEPIILTLDGAYSDSRGQNLKLPASKTLLLDWIHSIKKIKHGVNIDGHIADWKKAEWIDVRNPQDFDEGWDWHGPEDGNFRIAVTSDEQSLYIAIDAFDDIIHPGESERTDPQDCFTIFLNPPSVTGSEIAIEVAPLVSGKCAVRFINGEPLAGVIAACRISENKIFAEIAIPGIMQQKPGSDLRVNVAFEDHDNPNNTKPSILYWRPKWGSSADYFGSGTFKLQ